MVSYTTVSEIGSFQLSQSEMLKTNHHPPVSMMTASILFQIGEYVTIVFSSLTFYAVSRGFPERLCNFTGSDHSLLFLALF